MANHDGHIRASDGEIGDWVIVFVICWSFENANVENRGRQSRIRKLCGVLDIMNLDGESVLASWEFVAITEGFSQ
jgi:hypothetical protein